MVSDLNHNWLVEVQESSFMAGAYGEQKKYVYLPFSGVSPHITFSACTSSMTIQLTLLGYQIGPLIYHHGHKVQAKDKRLLFRIVNCVHAREWFSRIGQSQVQRSLVYQVKTDLWRMVFRNVLCKKEFVPVFQWILLLFCLVFFNQVVGFIIIFQTIYHFSTRAFSKQLTQQRNKNMDPWLRGSQSEMVVYL